MGPQKLDLGSQLGGPTVDLGAGCPNREDQFRVDTRERPMVRAQLTARPELLPARRREDQQVAGMSHREATEIL